MKRKTSGISLLIALGMTAVSSAHATPVSLSSLSSSYTQNFNTLSKVAGSTTNASLPTGWAISETGGGARDNELYAVGTGSSTTGDIYSFGESGATDRALGSLLSATLVPMFGAQFTNNTGATITMLDIAYTGELWRRGTAHRADRLAFQYSTDATSLTTGTYLNFSALDFVSPTTSNDIGALNGNDRENSTAIAASILGLKIAANSSFWIRWNDVDALGADDGMAVDNFSLKARSSAVPEPGSLMLAGIALFGLFSTRRRSR